MCVLAPRPWERGWGEANTAEGVRWLGNKNLHREHGGDTEGSGGWEIRTYKESTEETQRPQS